MALLKQSCCVAGRFSTNHLWLSPRCIPHVSIYFTARTLSHWPSPTVWLTLIWSLTAVVSLVKGLEVTLRMFWNSASGTVWLFYNSQISVITHKLVNIMEVCDCTKRLCEAVTLKLTTSPSLTELHQQSDHCGKVLLRPGWQKEGASERWRAWSTRLYFRGSVREKQVGRVQRQPEDREGREVRQKTYCSCVEQEWVGTLRLTAGLSVSK